MEADDFLLIGRVAGVHGIKGALKIFSFADSLSVFDSGNSIHLKINRGKIKTYRIE